MSSLPEIVGAPSLYCAIQEVQIGPWIHGNLCLQHRRANLNTSLPYGTFVFFLFCDKLFFIHLGRCSGTYEPTDHYKDLCSRAWHAPQMQEMLDVFMLGHTEFYLPFLKLQRTTNWPRRTEEKEAVRLIMWAGAEDHEITMSWFLGLDTGRKKVNLEGCFF